MEKQISPGLRSTFLAHFVVALVLGFVFLLIPETYGNLVNWQVNDPFMFRMFGGVTLGLGVASWLAYKETVFEKVKIVVVMEIFWTSLGTLISVWGVLFDGLPMVAWINAIMLAAFAAAFSFFYLKK